MKIRYILLPVCVLALEACTAQPAVQPVTLVPASTTASSTMTATTTSTMTEQSPAPTPATEQPMITEEAKPHGQRGEFCSPHGAVSIEGYVCTYKGKAWRWE